MNTNLAYQDEYRQELINGHLVMMSPQPATNHNRISYNICNIFQNHLNGRKCEAFIDGMAVYLTETDHFVPDVTVVCDPNKVKYDAIYGAPDLVVEVLSPSTSKRDRGYKKDVYAQCGVKEYWLVSPTEKSVEQYLLQNSDLVFHDVFTVYPDYLWNKMTEDERAEIPTEFKCSLYDDLVIKLDDIFARVN